LEGKQVKNLNYVTRVNDRHNITVATWNNNGNANVLNYKFTVDGVVIDEGLIKDANAPGAQIVINKGRITQ
jgi:hypothetical protein